MMKEQDKRPDLDAQVWPEAAGVQPQPVELASPPLAFSGYKEARAWCEIERANVVACVRQAADREMPVLASQLLDVFWFVYIRRQTLGAAGSTPMRSG